MTKRVGILLFDGVEELDYCGPYEVFSLANRCSDDMGLNRPFALTTIGEHEGLITSAGGLRVMPDAICHTPPDVDILVVPGGPGTRRVEDLQPVVDYIKDAVGAAQFMTSVCTGSFLLARAGLLDGLKATTHWASIDRLRAQFPAVVVLDNSRVVDEGRVITAGGISSGIDLGLHLVEKLCSRDLADRVKKRMEWSR